MTWLQIPRPSNGQFQWRERADGSTEVLSSPRPWTAYRLAGPDAGSKATEQWRALATDAAATTGVPVHWILGIIYSESQGNPQAHTGSSPCHGLMQIMGSVAQAYGVQNVPQDLYDPATNIITGARILADHRKHTTELPRVASMYNAGPSAKTGGAKVSTKNPWGLVQDPDYIDHVVMSSNWFLGNDGPSPAPSPAPSPGTSNASSGALVLGLGLLWVFRKHL